MGINLNPFTWWNGASLGTMFGLVGNAIFTTQLLQSALASQVKDGGGAGRPTTAFWTLQPGEGRALPAPE